MKFHPLFFLILLLTSSCSKLLTQKPVAPLPQYFKHQTPETQTLERSQEYWKILNDEALNTLIEKTLKQNSELKASAYRLERDFAAARVQLSQLFPSVSTNSSFERKQYSENTGQPVGTFFPRNQNLWTLPLDLQYEIDLWGRVRNAYKAQKAEAKATYFLHQRTRSLLISETLKSYFAIQKLQTQSKAEERIFSASKKIYELEQALYKQGLVSEESMLRKGSDALIAKDDWNATNTLLAIQTHSLAILVGESPSEFSIQASSLTLDKYPNLLPDQIPSTWIARRNDVQAAEQKVIASQALTKSAIAEFFPKITFDLRYGVTSQNFSNLFSAGSTFFSLGPQVSLPLFNAGKNWAQYQGRKKEVLATLEDYRQVVLKALKEVEDSLVRFQEMKEKDAHGIKLIQDARHVYKQNQAKGKAGLNSARQTLFSEIETAKAERESLQRRYDLLISWVAAVTSLGE